MIRALMTLAFCFAAEAQRFDVASVKPSEADQHSTSGIQTGHGRLHANNVTLKRCIMGAYGVGPHQISGGPDWMESDRFEILAKADPDVNDDSVLMAMLKDLLADRFKLALHTETKIVSAYVLEVAKNGPKLEKAEPGEAGTNSSNSNTGASIDAHNTDMDSLARVLSRQMELPIVNGTGLKGIFNFKLHWTPESVKPADKTMDGVSLFTAIQEQLGLQLRQRKSPVQIFVVDHVERPSSN